MEIVEFFCTYKGGSDLNRSVVHLSGLPKRSYLSDYLKSCWQCCPEGSKNVLFLSFSIYRHHFFSSLLLQVIALFYLTGSGHLMGFCFYHPKWSYFLCLILETRINIHLPNCNPNFIMIHFYHHHFSNISYFIVKIIVSFKQRINVINMVSYQPCRKP